MFNSDGQNFIAECWLPVDQLAIVQAILRQTNVSRSIRIIAQKKFQCSLLPVRLLRLLDFKAAFINFDAICFNFTS